MPYDTIGALPQPVREHLPSHAQEIYLAAFNSAWKQYNQSRERREGRTREETAHAVAWSAVERTYHKDQHTGRWVQKGE